MKFRDLEDEYLRHLAMQRGCSPNTIRTYQSAFARCCAASAAIGVPDPDLAVVDRRWANQLVQELGRTLRPRTVHRNITAWRGLAAYAVEEGCADRNPLVGIRLPRKDAVQRTPVTTEDLTALLQATARLYNPVRASQARALILTAATTAPRYSDLMPLRACDVDLGAGVLTIRRGKGNKSRVIPLAAETVASLREWLTVRREWLATRSCGDRITQRERESTREPDALWLADRGRPLGEDGLRRYMRELCFLAGIERTITLHDIRHSAATRMARQGLPLVAIQAVLGHSSLTTTQGYIAGAGPQQREWAERMALLEVRAEQKQTAISERNLPRQVRRTARLRRKPR